jgi:hypothetical protein
LSCYTEEAWYQRFLELYQSSFLERRNPSYPPSKKRIVPRKIVLVSDFINKVGGIETYLHDVKAILEAQGHQVILRGGTLPQ